MRSAEDGTSQSNAGRLTPQICSTLISTRSWGCAGKSGFSQELWSALSTCLSNAHCVLETHPQFKKPKVQRDAYLYSRTKWTAVKHLDSRQKSMSFFTAWCLVLGRRAGRLAQPGAELCQLLLHGLNPRSASALLPRIKWNKDMLV